MTYSTRFPSPVDPASTTVNKRERPGLAGPRGMRRSRPVHQLDILHHGGGYCQPTSPRPTVPDAVCRPSPVMLPSPAEDPPSGTPRFLERRGSIRESVMKAPAMLADHFDAKTDAIIALWRRTVEREGDVPE